MELSFGDGWCRKEWRRRQLRDLARRIGYEMSINNCDWECTKNAKDWTTFVHDLPSDLSKQLYDEGKDRAFFARLQIFCDLANKQGYISSHSSGSKRSTAFGREQTTIKHYKSII